MNRLEYFSEEPESGEPNRDLKISVTKPLSLDRLTLTLMNNGFRAQNLWKRKCDFSILKDRSPKKP